MSDVPRKIEAIAFPELVNRLVGELAPVKPIRLVRAVVQAIGVQAAVVGATAWVAGVWMADAGRLRSGPRVKGTTQNVQNLSHPRCTRM